MSNQLPTWVIPAAESARDKARESRNRNLAERLEDSRSVCATAMAMLALNAKRDRVLEWSDPLPASTVEALSRLRREASRPWSSGG